MHAYRSQTCADLSKRRCRQTVRLSGWVHRVRDHGGVLFIDLRDHYGVTQICRRQFARFRRSREGPLGMVHPHRGQREGTRCDPRQRQAADGRDRGLRRAGSTVLGRAGELPLPVFGEPDYPRRRACAYRFLDLRRERLHGNMMLRSRVVKCMRNRMWNTGSPSPRRRSSPPRRPKGRATLAAKAPASGQVLCAAQAPQQFKQLIMVGGPTAASRSRPASATRTRAPTARPPSAART